MFPNCDGYVATAMATESGLFGEGSRVPGWVGPPGGHLGSGAWELFSASTLPGWVFLWWAGPVVVAKGLVFIWVTLEDYVNIRGGSLDVFA